MAEQEIPHNEEPNTLQAYAGQWVAFVDDHLAGSGASREAAIKDAKSSNPDAFVKVRLIPPPESASLYTILDLIRPALSSNPKIYVVGGAVRDHLLKRPIQDLDFVLEGNGIPAARKAANYLGGEFYALDDVRGTGRVLLFHPDGRRLVLDFGAQRGETLDADLKARDFTINALAINVHDPSEVFDPMSGALDIRNRRLHICSPDSFSDDPLRVLRAVRIAASLKFTLSSETREKLRQSAKNLNRISAERLRDELMKILGGPKPAAALRVMEILGVLPHVFPEVLPLKGLLQPVPHVHDVWEHTLSTIGHLDNLLGILGALDHDPEASGNLASGVAVMRLGRYREMIHTHLRAASVPERKWRGMLMLAALYHDTGKASTRSLDENGRIRFLKHEVESARLIDRKTNALKLSNLEAKRLHNIVRHHMRPHFLVAADGAPTRRAIYRFFRDTQIAGVDICLLNLADVLATYERTLPPELWQNYLDVNRELLENWWERPTETVLPEPVINGRDIMQRFGLDPGPKIGEYLEMVRESQATGEITVPEEAFKLVEEAIQKEA